MNSQTISILEGSTFVVSDRRGDVEATPTSTEGLFAADMRFLSRWTLTIDGKRMDALSTDDLEYFAASFFLVPATGSIYENPKLSVFRRRAVDEGFHEDLTVRNHGREAIEVDIRVEAAADFADIFEIKDALAKKGQFETRVEDGELVLGYKRERFVRETRIRSSEKATIDEHGLSFKVRIDPHGSWTTCLDVKIVVPGFVPKPGVTPKKSLHDDTLSERASKSLDRWVSSAPTLVSSWHDLERTYSRSLVDLAALRYFPIIAPESALPAAGLPWFMTVFGRDSVITSFQALPFVPELAKTTLCMLGLRQGTRRDDFREEEPGKILHEVRAGELTAFEERPQSPYFGGADTTPLFLILLDEYERWTRDDKLVRGLEKQARAALRWIDEWGDRDGDGYVEYERRMPTGLENQCWKDSWDSIAFADGTLASLPRATCEIQGYVYDAKVRMARLARSIWKDEELAQRLEREAADLKARFNRDFWIPERRFFALALDGEKRKVDSLTSNIGHLLWSGIVEDDKVQSIADHLLSDALFSGWGVRTMAEGEGSFNPIGYHVGTVWPHDTSIIAWGLRRSGFREHAARLALGVLEAAVYFEGRLPEAFAGYARGATRYPVEYPTACSPQAWATGAPLLMLRTLLGLEPVDGHLLVDPAVPTTIQRLELLGIPGSWGTADAFGRGRIDLGQRRAA